MGNKNQLILYPSKIKNFLFLILCIGFVLIGIWMIIDKEPLGWFVALTFAIGIPVFVIMMLPGSTHLKLDKDGFETRTLFRCSTYSWKDISIFIPGKIGGNETVLFNFSPHYEGQEAGRKVALAISGVEGALPDTYGKKAEDLAEIMNEWKSKYST